MGPGRDGERPAQTTVEGPHGWSVRSLRECSAPSLRLARPAGAVGWGRSALPAPYRAAPGPRLTTRNAPPVKPPSWSCAERRLPRKRPSKPAPWPPQPRTPSPASPPAGALARWRPDRRRIDQSETQTGRPSTRALPPPQVRLRRDVRHRAPIAVKSGEEPFRRPAPSRRATRPSGSKRLAALSRRSGRSERGSRTARGRSRTRRRGHQ